MSGYENCGGSSHQDSISVVPYEVKLTADNLEGANQRLSKTVAELQDIYKRLSQLSERLIGPAPETPCGEQKDQIRPGVVGSIHNACDAVSRELGNIRSTISKLETA